MDVVALSLAKSDAAAKYAHRTDVSTALRAVAFRSNHYGASTYQSASGFTSATYRTQHLLLPGITASGIRLLYGAFELNPSPTPLYVRANLQWNGKSYQVTWNGSSRAVLPRGGAQLSDPIAAVVLDPSVVSYCWIETFVLPAVLVNVNGSPTGGTFTITIGGQTTTALPYNATAGMVQAAISALSSVGAGNVEVTGGAASGYAVFLLGPASAQAITATATLTGGSSPTVTVTAGRWPVGLTLNSSNGEGSNAAAPGADLTVDGQYSSLGATPPLSSTQACYSPMAVLGIPNTPVRTIGGLGDSLMTGIGDGGSNYGAADTRVDFGYFLRAANRQYGHVFYAKFNDTAQNMLTTAPFRSRALDHATDVFCGLGTNDLNAGRTAAQLAGDLIAHARQAAARRQTFSVMTLAPRTTSTNQWATVAGQTPYAGEAQRVVFNTWVRAGCPVDPTALTYVAAGTAGALVVGQAGHPFTCWFEVADSVESARNSGLFKAAERYVSDGAFTNASTTLTSATAAFTSADVGKALVITDGAGAGSVLQTTIISVQSATSVTIGTPATNTGSTKLVVIDPEVVDGVHWGPRGHAHAAAAINLATLTGGRPAFA